MKGKHLTLLVATTLCLTSCSLSKLDQSKNNSHALSTNTGYLCTAANAEKNDRQNTAWAIDQDSAKSYAMSHCQSTGGDPRCSITQCVWADSRATIADSRWYTCYIYNHNHRGIWSATARDRFVAIRQGYSRCRHFSDDPSSCYVSYCSLW